jgi:hypothetical protein
MLLWVLLLVVLLCSACWKVDFFKFYVCGNVVEEGVALFSLLEIGCFSSYYVNNTKVSE